MFTHTMLPAPISTAQFSATLTSLMRQTLVVGGEASFVTRKLALRLAKHGLFMAHHWPWKKQNGSFPDNIEVVFICTDMCSHPASNAAVAEANKRGIPVIMGTRKHAVNIDRLIEAGFPEIPELSPQPMVSPKREAQRAAAHLFPDTSRADTKKIVAGVLALNAALGPATSVIPMDRFPIPAASKPETMPMPTLPKSEKSSIIPTLRPASMHELTEVQRKILTALAGSPGISNRALAEQYSLSHGQTWSAVTWGRTVLGIATSEGKQKNVQVNAKTYKEVCVRLGLDHVAIPASGLYPKENLRTKPDARPAGRPRKTPTYSLVNGPTAARVVATVATSEVPPEVLAATPANPQRPLRVERIDGSARDLGVLPKVTVVKGTDDAGQPVTLHLTKPPVGEPNPSPALKAALVPSAVDPMQDMKDAVALLRAVMSVHGVETITVTPTTTSLRRVVVVVESLD